jgi:hypothetical protein
VEDEKILHAAALMAEYLDNDEDGVVDNELVLSAMNESRAFLVMWKRESDLDFEPPDGRIGQDLGADETRPSWHNGVGEFDAGLEEVLHLVTHAGYAQAYPEIFGERAGTLLCDAMDIARGGRFESVPDTYPDEAWYTYDDRTCDYSCMSTEYIYWALTSLLGAQERRADEIGHEWRLHTPELLTETDLAVSVLLTDPDYKFPTVLPDGIYR